MKTHLEKRLIQRTTQTLFVQLGLAIAVLVLCMPQISQAATAGEISRDSEQALQQLYQSTPAAKKMGSMAKAILVFPNIIKGGFIIGGQYGEGALQVKGKTTGFYRSIAASYGLQIGAQSFGYALFFLDNDSLRYLRQSDGWEIGVGPSVVVMDQGLARSFTTTTYQSGIYAFFFNQQGLMAGLGIQGSKITGFQPD